MPGDLFFSNIKLQGNLIQFLDNIHCYLLHKPGPVPWARCQPDVYAPLLRSLNNPKDPPSILAFSLLRSFRHLSVRHLPSRHLCSWSFSQVQCVPLATSSGGGAARTSSLPINLFPDYCPHFSSQNCHQRIRWCRALDTPNNSFSPPQHRHRISLVFHL